MKQYLRRILFGMFIGLAVLGVPSIAAAQDAVAEVNPSDTLASIELSAVAVTALVSLFIPIVVGLITKVDLNPLWKGAVNIVLSAINAVVVTSVVAGGTAVISQETLVTAFFGMVVSLATYFQVYRPLDINNKLAPTKGI